MFLFMKSYSEGNCVGRTDQKNRAITSNNNIRGKMKYKFKKTGNIK